jgi:GT2 family glycosyltransferase
MKTDFDIIIPVYNNFALTQACIESVIRHTSNHHTIIIVDDYSNDVKIYKFEDSCREKYPNIIIIRQPTNKGFLQAANIGMQFSKKDIILLNNDTIVTQMWSDKLNIAAYSKQNIASASAMSNNSTITSMPNYFCANKIPDFFTLDEMADFVEKHSLKLYPTLPTAMGFCMYIKRSALDDVGYYDEIYGKGYCEENDWSLRARMKGWIHVMDDTTYIYHKGCGSFGDKKRAMILEHNFKILLSRYPEYSNEINMYIKNKINYEINKNLHYALLRYRLKNKINI